MNPDKTKSGSLSGSVIFFSLLVIAGMAAGLAAASGTQKFTGVITDSMCADADHSRMRMGPTDAECARACNDDHGAPYVLYDGKIVYSLSDQKAPEKFAGQKVTVTGALDTKSSTIQVDSIASAK